MKARLFLLGFVLFPSVCFGRSATNDFGNTIIKGLVILAIVWGIGKLGKLFLGDKESDEVGKNNSTEAKDKWIPPWEDDNPDHEDDEMDESKRKIRLIECDACDNMVSEMAKSCPQCGHPM